MGKTDKKPQSQAEKKAIILAKIQQIRERKESKSPAAKSAKGKAQKQEENKAKPVQAIKVRKSESTDSNTKARFPEGSVLIRVKDVPLSGARVKHMWLVDDSYQLLQKFTVDDDEDYYIRTQQFTKYHESDGSKYLAVKVEKVEERGKRERIKVAYPETTVLMDAKAQQAALKQIQQSRIKKNATKRSQKSA